MTENTEGPGTLLVVGATGRVGRYVVTEAVRQGFTTRALVRDASRAGRLDGSAHDWKRRGERLVRASGNPYTIARPGWFDYNGGDQLAITLPQGDTRHAGSPADGVIARHQIARVRDQSTMPDNAEPDRVRRDLGTLTSTK
ncbi:NAD(P)H-binding protein [Arthrobacter dokdonensis]|uniref:NAD(P)H-binding protein n=1 Tax=Arthrobacter dokdonellae TaxID=2211210 RepID=UPI000DE5A1F5|nr:NAD(P)H-binding protein [Arthrobacter dokdonellae]